jgi:hypothetical protein
MPSLVSKRLRLGGIPNNSTPARIVEPAVYQGIPLYITLVALQPPVAAVVFTVNVTVCAVSPLIVTEAGTLHVAGSEGAFELNAQLKLTVPVNPPVGVTVIVELFPVVVPGVTVTAVPVIVKPGGRLMV